MGVEGSVIIVRGVPGSGKSTVSALLRDRLQPCIRISNDTIRYLAYPRGFNPERIRASERGCFALALDYAWSGFCAVIDGVFEDIDLLDDFMRNLKSLRIRCEVFTISTSLEVLLDRNGTRDAWAHQDESRIIQLHCSLIPYGRVLDAQDRTAEEVSEMVFEHFPTGVSRVANGVEILFVRHGQAQGHPEIYPDAFSLGLSEVGVSQAKALARIVELFSPDKVYSSDMLRASETASYATGGAQEIFLASELRERAFHSRFGLPTVEAFSDMSEQEAIVSGKSDLVDLEGEETLDQARARVVSFVKGLGS